MTIADSILWKAIIALATSFSMCFDLYGQSNINGSFESLDKNLLPENWLFSASSAYGKDRDTLTNFDGCISIHITPSKTCNSFDSYVIFRRFQIDPANSAKTFTFKYMVKFQRREANSDGVAPYINAFRCPGRADIDKSIKIVIDSKLETASKAYGDWELYTVKGKILDSRCEELYIGFVVDGVTDVYIDHITFVLNGLD